MRTVFVINPSVYDDCMYPSGILYLSAYLTKHGIRNCIVKEPTEEETIKKVLKLRPLNVCFSANHRSFDEVVRMNKALKVNKDINSIVGGSQATYRPDFLNNGFDYVCIGEGEKTLYDFVSGVNFKDIPGLAWKCAGQTVYNVPRSMMSEKELNEVTMPAYNKINNKGYFGMTGSIIRGMVLKGAMILTTRGCPQNCSFCGCNLIFGRRLRRRSLKNIEAEVKYLKNKHGIEGVWIIDDTFTIGTEHVIGVARILNKYGLIWGCQSRVNTLSEDLIKVMKDNGCVQIDFGVESGSQRILDDIIGKGTKIQQVKDSFALTKKYGIRSLANFMIGFPTETMAELQQTIDLAEEIKADTYIFSIATPLPGTRMFDMVGEVIKPEEYSLMNWDGSELTDRLNKSEIKNIRVVLKQLQRKYERRSVLGSLVSWGVIKFFLTRPRKVERIAMVMIYLNKFLKRQIK